MRPLVDPLPKLLLLLHRQMYRLLANRAATPLIGSRTVRTLDKQQVTALIPAIRMGVCRLTALVTTGDDLPADPFPKTIVKDKVLAPELVLQPLLLHLIGIIDDSPFQVEDIVKALVKQVSAGLLATDPTPYNT